MVFRQERLQYCQSSEPLYSFIQKVGAEFLLDTAKNHEELVIRIEVVRTMLHLVLLETEKNPKLTLNDFVNFLERIEKYGENIPLAIFSPNEGVKVLTLHGSKGLEFDYVWIAHMDERSLSGGKKMNFTLPENIASKIEERDIDAIKRKLYVAITRAKRFCTLSYATESANGSNQELAKVIAQLPKEVFKKEKAKAGNKEKKEAKNLSELKKLVLQKYPDRYVSVSLLNNFFECPWKWYFKNLLGLPEPVSDSLEFGSKIHAAIDKVLKLGRAPSEEELKKLMLEDEAMDIISVWVANRLPQIKPNFKNEQSVRITDKKFPHLNMYGKIDLIENLNAGEVRVTDFKTGSVRKKSDIEKIDPEGRMSGNLRQLAMYSYLLKENPKWKVGVRESRLEFLEAQLPQEAFYDRVITDKEIELLIKDINDYNELVKTGEWVNRPCNYNSYGKTPPPAGGCEYCKLAEIYK